MKKVKYFVIFILLIFVFMFKPISIFPGNQGIKTGTETKNNGAEFRLLSLKGKVKVKKGDDFFAISVENMDRISLGAGDALLVYPSSSAEILLPKNNKLRLNGPLYSTSSKLGKKNFDRISSSFFAQSKLLEILKLLFDAEGDEAAGTTRGTIEDSLNFFNEIDPVAQKANIEDQTLSTADKKKMDEMLSLLQTRFNAFSGEKQIIMRCALYKTLGLHKTALTTIFTYYKGILNVKGKQTERELLEDYLFKQFLPVVVVIHPIESIVTTRGVSPSPGKPFNKEFRSNLKLWWASFYYDGAKFIPIEKTIDHSLLPQDSYIIKNSALNQLDSLAKRNKNGKSKSHDIFVVGCSDWQEIERYDDLKYAEKEILKQPTKPAKDGTATQDFGKVIIKMKWRE